MKRARPDVPIMFGGPQASVVDVPTMEAYPFVDFVVRGEAEQSLPALITAIAAGTSSSRHSRGYPPRRRQDRAGAERPIIPDLDDIPLPAFHLYPELKNCHYVPLELGRGCPFACTFCSTNDFFRRKFRLKSPARVIEQMKLVRDVYGIVTFDLIHDMFTVDRKRVVAFCEALIESGEEFYWNCSARTDCIDAELIAIMARAGCKGIFFGIETGSARLQKIVKKNIDLDEAMTRIADTDRHGITTAVSLITGFPDENMNDLRDTVHFFMDALRFDFAEPQLHILAPLAETPLESRYRSQLVFDDILSDMSHQGWRQDPIDRDMIQQHADIFPNFYSIPTPALSRAWLRELREFVLNGSVRFRWLLIALHGFGRRTPFVRGVPPMVRGAARQGSAARPGRKPLLRLHHLYGITSWNSFATITPLASRARRACSIASSTMSAPSIPRLRRPRRPPVNTTMPRMSAWCP